MSGYVQSPTGILSDREVLDALMNIPGIASLDQERLDTNIIMPKSAGMYAAQRRTLDKSVDIKSAFQFADTDRRDKTSAAMLQDTIHYLSPASATPLSARTENEGDIYAYQYRTPSFMHLIPSFGAPEGSYASSTISCVEPELQHTLAIVKPEAMEYEDVILRAIVDAGFSIIHKRYIHFAPEQVSEIYAQYYGSPAFPYMVVKMSVGPILSLGLAGINAIEKWKNMVGPERAVRAEWFVPMSLRTRFGLHEDIPDALHASENLSDANKENRYVNPEGVLEPLIADEAKVTDYCNMYINSTLLNGLVEVIRIKPHDPIVHLADWLLKNNQFQPRFPPNIAVLPT